MERRRVQRKMLLFLGVFLLTLLMRNESIVHAAGIEAPKELKLYNPKREVVLLEWSEVKDAQQYYIYVSTEQNQGYRMICSTTDTSLVLHGLTEYQRYFFKVYARGKCGVSDASPVVSGKRNIRGIDVSKHNQTIDWKTVKESGLVDFAIIRCGYGDDMLRQDDEQFERNYKECNQYDIPVGVYLYSYADSIEHAQSEAEHVLRLIRGKKFPYKVWYDLEDGPTVGTMNEKQLGDMAELFCNAMEKAGFEVGIYANKHWFENILTDRRFQKWDKWVAQYNDECNYSGVYIMWQNASDGSIPGIEGRVDTNYAFTGIDRELKGLPTYDISKGLAEEILQPQDLEAEVLRWSSVRLAWKEAVGSSCYKIYRSLKPTEGYTEIGTSSTTEFVDTNVLYGRNYYYKVCGWNEKVTSDYSESVKVTFTLDKPQNLTCKEKDFDKIRLSWEGGMEGETAIIYRSLQEKTGFTEIGRTNRRFFYDKNVKIGTTYYYRIRYTWTQKETQKVHNGAYSSVGTYQIRLGAPASPKVQSIDYETLRITFSKVQGAAYYEIYRSDKKNGTYKRIAVTKGNIYIDSGRKTGKDYFYKIRGVWNVNGKDNRGSFSKVIQGTPALNNIKGYYGKPRSGQNVFLKWNKLSGADGYYLYRSTSKNGAYTKIGQTDGNYFIDSRTKTRKVYYYRIQAYRMEGNYRRYSNRTAAIKVTVVG